MKPLPLVLAFLVTACYADFVQHIGFCGNQMLPYRISVNGRGILKLSCVRYQCVDNGDMDHNLLEQESAVKCDLFDESNCSGELQWTGGLVEVDNGKQSILKATCCSHPAMRRSQLIRTVLLGPNDRYEGGPTHVLSEFSAFDIIKEVRKSLTIDGRPHYVVTIHRMLCTNGTRSSYGTDGSDNDGYPSVRRNKRRLREEKKEQDNTDDIVEGDHRSHREVADQIEQPPTRHRPAYYRRRPVMRTYEDDYYDYEYEIYVPHQTYGRKRSKGNRLWPFIRAHTDDGIYEAKEVVAIKSEPDVAMVESGSRTLDFKQVAPVARASLTRSAGGYQAGYQNPSQAHQLPQYIPAYRDPAEFSQVAHAHQVPIQPAPQAQLQPYYTYYSYPNPSLNTLFDTLQCFSGDMKVETPSGSKAIEDLEIGDMVLSIDESMVTFSPVIMFLHKVEDEQGMFLHINTESGYSLKLTENHLMYVSSCASPESLRLIAAKEARIGQCLQLTTGDSVFTPKRIISISKVMQRGIYAPLTATGDIIVNRCLVSCHSNLALKTLQQTFFSVYRSLSSTLHHYLPKLDQEDSHLPVGIHYLTTVADLFLPSSLLEIFSN